MFECDESGRAGRINVESSGTLVSLRKDISGHTHRTLVSGWLQVETTYPQLV